MKADTLEKLDLNFGELSRKIERFISGYIVKSSSKGLVIGLSGGLDSSVVLKLCVNAIGKSRVLGVVMPSDTTPKEDTAHAIKLAKSLGIKYRIINIGPLLDKYEQVLPNDKRARGNLMARVRMNVLYYYAGVNSHLVTGTSDKSELCLGYFTKFGDGAADIAPIADLYKTQVRALAKYLGIPKEIIEKKSSPRLWRNHLAEEEIGMDYEMIDSVLYLLVERKMKTKYVAKKLEISVTHVDKIKAMLEKSQHKRSLPPFPHN